LDQRLLIGSLHVHALRMGLFYTETPVFTPLTAVPSAYRPHDS
jgi:hypothetical protein